MDESLQGPGRRLVDFMQSASLSYVVEVCEKHFGKIFTEIHELGLDSNSPQLGGVERQLLTRLYKIAVPNARVADKNIEACSKTLKKDLIVSPLTLQVWRLVENRVIEGMLVLKLHLGGDKLASSFPIEDVRRSFSLHSKGLRDM
jgi:hypothetical protein